MKSNVKAHLPPRGPGPAPAVSVIIGVKNAASVLQGCLDSVAAQMKQQCTACINTLRENTGPSRDPMAAEPLYPSAATTLKGDRGQVGPFEWWRRARAAILSAHFRRRMPRVFVPKETRPGETRVAASPETAKRLVQAKLDGLGGAQ